MSRMEIFYGVLEKSDLNIKPEDTDDFYDLEEECGKRFVKVNGQLYAFWEEEKLEDYGFSTMIKPSDKTRFIAYWYNGGAGIHEVVEDLIKRYKDV